MSQGPFQLKFHFFKNRRILIIIFLCFSYRKKNWAQKLSNNVTGLSLIHPFNNLNPKCFISILFLTIPLISKPYLLLTSMDFSIIFQFVRVFLFFCIQNTTNTPDADESLKISFFSPFVSYVFVRLNKYVYEYESRFQRKFSGMHLHVAHMVFRFSNTIVYRLCLLPFWLFGSTTHID